VSNSKAVADIGGTLVTRVLLIPLTLASSILVARILGPSGKGVYSTALTVMEIAMFVGALGIAKAATYLLARGEATKGVRETALAMTLANGIALTGVLALFILLATPTLLPGVPQTVLLLALPIPLLTLLRSTWEGFLRAEQRNHTINGIGLAFSASFLLGVVAAALLRVGVNTVVGLRTLTALLAAALVFAVVCRQAGLRMRMDRRIVRRLLVLGVPYAIVSLAQKLNLDADILIIQAYMSNQDVGWYSVSAAVAEMLLYLPVAVGFVLFPRTAAAEAGDASRDAATMQRWTFTLTLCAGVVLVVIAAPLVALAYGPDFAPAAGPLRILVPGIIGTVWFQVLGSYLMGRGQVWALAAVTGVGVSVNIGLNVLLVPRLGISGAALASSISYTVTGGLALMYFCRRTGMNARATLLLSPSEFSAGVRRIGDGLRRARKR